MNRSLRTLKSKLLLMSVICTGAALLATIAMLGIHDYTAMRAQMASDALTQARIVAGNCTASLSFDDEKDAAQTLASLHAEPHVAGAAVFTATGRLMATYFRDAAVPLAKPAELADAPFQFRNDRLEVCCPVALNAQRLGWVFIAYDLDALHASIHQYELLFGVALLDLLEHGVEAVDQRAELVVAGAGGADGVVAVGGDLAGGVA